MKKGCGTLTELTSIWRYLNPAAKWDLVEKAYDIKNMYDHGLYDNIEYPSQEETLLSRPTDYPRAEREAEEKALYAQMIKSFIEHFTDEERAELLRM